MRELIVVVASIAVGCLLKGITGLGLPLISIPLMASFIGVERAVIIMAIPTVVTNVVLLYDNRSARQDSEALRSLVPTGIAGAVVGTALLTSLDDRILTLAMAGLILGFLAVTVASPSFQLSDGFQRYASPPIGLFAGLLQGSMGTSGVLLATYLHGFRMSRETYVYSITLLFQAFASVQVVSLLVLGRYDGELLLLSVLTLPLGLVLLQVGIRLSKRLSVVVFQRLIIAMLVASGAKLLFDGLSG